PPMNPITINTPPALATELTNAARAAGITLQAYCAAALTRFVERYASNPLAIPSPLARPSPRHPTFTVRAPAPMRARSHTIKPSINQHANERGEVTTLAALVMLAYQQALQQRPTTARQ